MTVIMNLALWRGATIVSMTKFAVERMLRAIAQYRVTRLYAAPPIVLALTQHPDLSAADLSSLRFVLSGAAPSAPRSPSSARTGLAVGLFRVTA